jgi:hypothetical protein
MNQSPSFVNAFTRFPFGYGKWAVALALALAPALPAQTVSHGLAAKPAVAPSQPQSELEQGAMNALKTMSQQLVASNSFTFTARVMREEPGTNGQMLDFIKDISAQVERPNRMRFTVASDNSVVNVWYDGKSVTLMPHSGKIYTTLAAPPTIDATLAMLKDKLDTHTPLRPFLSTDPYSMLSDGLQSASVVGFENVGNERFLHLAFSEANADWQLWLSGPNEVLPRRMAIVYKNVPGQPRVEVEFSNWCLNAAIPGNAFAFVKPAGAVASNLTALRSAAAPKGAAARSGNGGETK